MPYIVRDKKDRVEEDLVLHSVKIPLAGKDKPSNVVDETNGVFRMVEIVLKRGEDYVHIRVYPAKDALIDYRLSEFELLKKLDALTAVKTDPMPKVHVSYYAVKNEGVNKKGDKEIYTNFRASMKDVTETWRVI